jgi:hypothetical protein
MKAIRRNSGAAVLETALLLPLLLVMIVGTYIACRSAFLKSAAESAAHVEAVRSGRRLPGIESRMADSILPGGQGVTIRSGRGKETRLLPGPFPSLAGRSKGIAEIDKDWEEVSLAAGFPRLSLSRLSEVSADCWDAGSSSGRKIRRAVTVTVATAVLR